MEKLKSTYYDLFDSAYGAESHFIVRWLFLHTIGLIYFSAFFALLFLIRGLIGPRSIPLATNYPQTALSIGILCASRTSTPCLGSPQPLLSSS